MVNVADRWVIKASILCIEDEDIWCQGDHVGDGGYKLREAEHDGAEHDVIHAIKNLCCRPRGQCEPLFESSESTLCEVANPTGTDE